MRFARFVADTEMRFGALTDDVVREFPAYRGHRDCFQRFVRDARQRGKTLDQFGESLLDADGKEYPWASLAEAAPGSDAPALLPPFVPEQVWAAAFTYAPPAGWNKYAAERAAERPIFFKSTGSHAVGPNDFIGVRADSNHTIPEPELALVLDEEGKVLAYTIANDVTALDFTNTSPLYVSYSKTYQRSLALGPLAVTASSLPDPGQLEMRLTVSRNDMVAAEGRSNTSLLLHSFEHLIRYTLAHNSLSLWQPSSARGAASGSPSISL